MARLEYEEARKDFDRVIELSPDELKAYCGRALAGNCPAR
jgi:hypothetical protein